jgi:hypothetical protein
MAELRNQIGSLVTEPQSLHAQRTGQSFFVDENTAPITNEGNLLSLMTMRDFYKNEEGKVPADIKKIFDNVAQEESRYMMSALKVLSAQTPAARKMQTKFGRDFDAAKSIAKLLKQKADEKEFEDTVAEFVKPLVDDRQGRKGGMIPVEVAQVEE